MVTLKTVIQIKIKGLNELSMSIVCFNYLQNPRHQVVKIGEGGACSAQFLNQNRYV